MFCSKCGTENQEPARFCCRCGADLGLEHAPRRRSPWLWAAGAFLIAVSMTAVAIIWIRVTRPVDVGQVNISTPVLTFASATSIPATSVPSISPAPTVTLIPTPAPLPLSRLEGQVLDEVSGEPIVGAQVVVGKQQATTDEGGRFIVADLTPGQYTILVSAEEYDPLLSGIVAVEAGEQAVVDAVLPPLGQGEYPEDPMATNQIDPAGAPTMEEAERLARLQGLQGEVVLARDVVLNGEYLVNYKKGDTIRSAVATLNHPGWELVDGEGQSWYIVRVCGNLAVARRASVEVPAQVVARPHPVVTVRDEGVVGRACPSDECEAVTELPAGWHSVVLACSTGCEWLRVQVAGVSGECWLPFSQAETFGDLDALPITSDAMSGKIAFFSDRDSPGYGEIYLMNPDGSEQTRLTSNLPVPRSSANGPLGVLSFRWSAASRKFFYSTYSGGSVYALNANGSGATVVADETGGFDVSPDGQRIVGSLFRPGGQTSDIVIMNADGTDRTVVLDEATRLRLGLEPESRLSGPTWSPDGTKIAFYTYTDNSICMIHLDGSAPEAFAAGAYRIAGWYMTWSPDSRSLVFPQTHPYSIGILDVATGMTTEIPQEGSAWHPDWSPDGNQIVFDRSLKSQNGTLDSQIWVMNADGSGLTQLTFEGKNCCPVWLP